MWIMSFASDHPKAPSIREGFFHPCKEVFKYKAQNLGMFLGEAFSKLGVLLDFLPISLHNLFFTTSDGFKS
jgi:hypothetical protein